MHPLWRVPVPYQHCRILGMVQGVATGRHHASHLANSGAWEAAVSEAGRNVGGTLNYALNIC